MLDEEEETLSPDASRRITTAASSVADQVSKAVSAAVQAISPGAPEDDDHFHYSMSSCYHGMIRAYEIMTQQIIDKQRHIKSTNK